VVARGEVWWYEPEDAGRRPVLILTRNGAIGVLNQVLGVPATRTIRDIPTEVRLDRRDGMPARCVLALDALMAVRPALCTRRITSLGPARLDEVCEALRLAVDC
jgi:mRNA interferase MazF